MESKLGFTKYSIEEFEAWIADVDVSRTVKTVQQHHTFRPSYSSFNNNNHFDLQQGMKDYHVNERNWRDIGQHFSNILTT